MHIEEIVWSLKFSSPFELGHVPSVLVKKKIEAIDSK